MDGTKYGHLVKTLPYREGRGGANAKEMVFMQGEDLEGFALNFIVGVYDETGDWAPGRGAHVHPFDECLVFFGYDDDDLAVLGSDMELALGREREKHYFSVPTFGIAAAGFPHCPLITRKVYRPFGHFHLALAAKYSGTPSSQKGETDGKKYDHLMKPMQVQKGPAGADAHQSVSVSGDDLEGMALNFTLSLHKEAGEWYPGKGSLSRPVDECLVFFGHKTDELSYLGAEITIELGPEHEKHTFDASTAVVLPAGLPHFPIRCNRIERPYSVMRIGLSPRSEGAWTA